MCDSGRYQLRAEQEWRISMDSNIALTMRGICMTFPGVKALDNVDFTLKKGEIRALMGENGAGKSTLIKCLTGVNKFEAGEMALRVRSSIKTRWMRNTKESRQFIRR